MIRGAAFRESGFTLVEVLLGAGLLAFLAAGASSVMVRMMRDSDRINRNQSSKIETARALDLVGMVLFNAAHIEPKEDLLGNGDRLYKGLSGLTSSANAPFCKYQIHNEEEVFSIVRVTSLLGRILTETTLQPWKESDINARKALRINYHSHFAYPFQLNSDGSVKPQPEIYLIDAENLGSRRYQVSNVAHVVTDQDPYTDEVVPGATFTYTSVTLQMPKPIHEDVQSPGSSVFISGSTVYASSTSIICVSATDGTLLSRDETTGTTTVLYDPRKDGMKIDRFNVSYLGTRSATILDPSQYTLFPSEIVNIGCVNAARISLFLVDRNLEAPKLPIRIERQILLNNMNFRRSANCGS